MIAAEVSELLTALRNTGEQLLEASLPTAQEVPKILGALVQHLEQHLEGLAEVELEKLSGLKGAGPTTEAQASAAQADATAAQAAAAAEQIPIASEPAAAEPQAAAPAPEGDEAAQLRERVTQLEAQLATAQAQNPPAVSSEGEPGASS